ncbi:MAG: hypothetical protein IKH22_04800 [Prevotella sp.]|nr:hypothetical protein [Prevotella sp.]
MKTYSKPEIKVRVLLMQNLMAASEGLEAKTEGKDAANADAKENSGISWDSFIEE